MNRAGKIYNDVFFRASDEISQASLSAFAILSMRAFQTGTERKSLNKRVRMEGWRQRRPCSNTKTPYREEEEKPT
jgi:hypothetical protein